MKFEEQDKRGLSFAEPSFVEPSYPRQIWAITNCGFSLGMICGFFSHPVKGICNLPKNGVKPLPEAWLEAVLTDVPRLGVKFAAFTAVWSSLNIAMHHYHNVKYFRSKVPRECNVLNDVISLTATVALFKSGQGFRVASRSAFSWGSVCSIFRVSEELLDMAALPLKAYNEEEYRPEKMHREYLCLSRN
ncbi:hypothetical protein FRX31_022745 [Thalictrum thalictroides]|uniref:Uncharacterized protein n=1 Tax=Thalictrum thalictroides TaxID=46969 RepID=A0A7J6VSW7_THATH|nr:hypothetical protein FRX31_022745 [Thalictrum thalictroides]